MTRRKLCVVCNRQPTPTGISLCGECRESRFNTRLDMYSWAARRARQYERRRWVKLLQTELAKVSYIDVGADGVLSRLLRRAKR